MTKSSFSNIQSQYLALIDNAKCVRCKRCIQNCGWGTYSFGGDKIIADHSKCVACGRCYTYCPEGAISIVKNTTVLRENANWREDHLKSIWKQAETAGIVISGMGTSFKYKKYFDHMLLDACQVTNPSIDPLREPMELKTFLGKKPDRIDIGLNDRGEPVLNTKMPPQIELQTPFVFGAMSYGSISLNAQKAIALAARALGIVMNTGEGGLHDDLVPFGKNIIVQVASGRFGVHRDYLNSGIAVEIKVGQGAKPGIGGHLPGEKIGVDISRTRMIPVGTDAISPAPHHDIYSIEDLRQLIFAIKEATNYEKPVSVKVAAVHNIAAIVSGIVRAGADIVYMDGYTGGTGAAPDVIKNHVGIPIELALAQVDQRLRDEGIRNEASLIAAGSIRSSADAVKAIALGADAVAIGTAVLVAMGCHVCGKCNTGNCSWGITTQRPELVRRLDPEVYGERIYNLISAWSHEIQEVLGAMGVNSIESLRGSRERLRGVELTEEELKVLGIKHAGL